MDSMTLFAKYGNSSYDNTLSGQAAVNTVYTSYGVGAGWKKEMTKSTNMFARIEGDLNQKKVADVTSAKSYNIPLVLASESQALSWLAIRGSIAHSLLGVSADGGKRLAGSTTVSAGVGMTFGDINIDGMVASNGINTNALDGSFNQGAASGGNFGFGDSMISRIGLTYNF
jgi:hypothetical protein